MRGLICTNEGYEGRFWVEYMRESDQSVERVHCSGAMCEERNMFDLEVLEKSGYSLEPDVEADVEWDWRRPSKGWSVFLSKTFHFLKLWIPYRSTAMPRIPVSLASLSNSSIMYLEPNMGPTNRKAGSVSS